MENNKLLSRIELENMLPDYAFGRLDSEQQEKFRLSIVDHPDLEEELKSVQEVFSRVEKMDFDSSINYRTRNLSVRVNRRLESKQDKKGFAFGKALAPVALLLIIYLFFSFNKKEDITNPDQAVKAVLSHKQNDKTLSKSEQNSEIVVSKNSTKNETKNKGVKFKSNIKLQTVNENNIDVTLLEDIINEQMIRSIKSSEDINLIINSADFRDILLNPGYLYEAEIFTIIEEIENAEV